MARTAGSASGRLNYIPAAASASAHGRNRRPAQPATTSSVKHVIAGVSSPSMDVSTDFETNAKILGVAFNAAALALLIPVTAKRLPFIRRRG
jgi:hypothetical protein